MFVGKGPHMLLRYFDIRQSSFGILHFFESVSLGFNPFESFFLPFQLSHFSFLTSMPAGRQAHFCLLNFKTM
jgi:hypothetical protein